MDTSDQDRIDAVVRTLFAGGYELRLWEPEGEGAEWSAEAWPIASEPEPAVVKLHAPGTTDVEAAEALLAEWQGRRPPGEG